MPRTPAQTSNKSSKKLREALKKGLLSTEAGRRIAQKTVSINKAAMTAAVQKASKVSKKKAAAVETAEHEEGAKKRRNHPGTVALREIRRYQKEKKMLIPKQCMSRYFRYIAGECSVRSASAAPLRMQVKALMQLHKSTETYFRMLFEDANDLVVHAKRVTMTDRDVDLAARRLSSRMS